LRNILVELLKKIGYTENSYDDNSVKSLRQEVAKWACVLDDPICKKTAVDKLTNHFVDLPESK